MKQAICYTRETAALSRASKLHRLGDEALDLALREVRDAGNVNVALTVFGQMLRPSSGCLPS